MLDRFSYFELELSVEFLTNKLKFTNYIVLVIFLKINLLTVFSQLQATIHQKVI